MLNLTDLPVEVIDTIFENLHEGKDLSALCYVSKYIYDIANPRLYRNFSYSPKINSHRRERARFRWFTRTLLAKPGLATHVRSIRLHEWINGDQRRTEVAQNLRIEPQPILIRPDVSRFIEAIAQAGIFARTSLDGHHGWEAELLSGGQDLILLLLVSLCPNLTSLRFTSLHCDLFYFLHGLSNIARKKSSHGLGGLRLEDVSISQHSYSDGHVTDLIYASSILRLPKMRNMELVGVLGRDYPPYRKIRSSKVKRITLRQCSFDGESITRILQAPSALDELVIDWELSPWPIENRWEGIKVRNALQCQKKSLRRLEIIDKNNVMHLNIRAALLKRLHGVEEKTNEPPRSYLIGSLVAYENLEYLQVPATILLGLREEIRDTEPIYSLLPKSLKHLSIPYISMEFLPDVGHMLNLKNSYLPNLRTIHLGSDLERVDSTSTAGLFIKIPYSLSKGPPLLPPGIKLEAADPIAQWTLHSRWMSYSADELDGDVQVLPSPQHLFFRLPIPMVLPRPIFSFPKDRLTLTDISWVKGARSGTCRVRVSWDENGELEGLEVFMAMGPHWFDVQVIEQRRKERAVERG